MDRQRSSRLAFRESPLAVVPVSVSRLAAAVVLFAGALAPLAGCADPGPIVEVHGMRLRPTADNYPLLSGYVVNLSGAPIGSADVFVTLYDEENQPLGEELVQVRRVAPGDSARFERRLDRPATAARLRYITAG